MMNGPAIDWMRLNADWLEWLALPGMLSLGLAIYAAWADRRRLRRSDPDAVGLVPWTGVAFWASLGAVALLGMAGKVWWGG